MASTVNSTMNLRETLRYAAPLAALPLFFGCTDEQASTPATGSYEAADIYSMGEVIAVHPEEARFTNVITPNEAQGIIEDIPMTDHQYPHQWHDDKSPVIGITPVRLDAHVALSGSKSDFIDNDAACDSLRLDMDGLLNPDEAYIGAIAISEGSEDKVQITWPLEADGTPSENIFLCMAEDAEPQDGVVLFVSDQPR